MDGNSRASSACPSGGRTSPSRHSLLGTYCTHYAVHFPVPKRFPAVNLVRPVLDALPTGRSGRFLFSAWVFLVVALSLFPQVLRGQNQKHIPPVDIIIKRALADVCAVFLLVCFNGL